MKHKHLYCLHFGAELNEPQVANFLYFFKYLPVYNRGIIER
jgi:hypothetical protein